MTETRALPKGLLDGKQLLITGVLTEASIAFRIAAVAQELGATVVLTGAGRSASLTERIARRLPNEAPVVPLDVTSDADLDGLAAAVSGHVDGLDGVIHAIGFAPPSALGTDFLSVGWADVATMLQISTYSLAALTRASLPLLRDGSSIVGLDFDASVAWPAYNWMGVAKAGLEATARYLARELGPRQIRVNLVSAGPLRTMAAKSIPGFDDLAGIWTDRSPMEWDVSDTEPAARTCIALLSDLMPATTGTIVYCDGGVHAIGA